MEKKRFAVAVKRGAEAEVPADWLQRLSAVPGVTVEGSFHQRAQILADDAAVEALRREMGDALRVEEIAERGPA